MFVQTNADTNALPCLDSQGLHDELLHQTLESQLQLTSDNQDFETQADCGEAEDAVGGVRSVFVRLTLGYGNFCVSSVLIAIRALNAFCLFKCYFQANSDIA